MLPIYMPRNSNHAEKQRPIFEMTYAHSVFICMRVAILAARKFGYQIIYGN